MSAKLLGLALHHGPVNHIRKALFTALVNFADDQDIAWPAVQTLAEYSSLSRSSVFAHLKILEADGWIRREKRITQHGQKTNRYLINSARLLGFELAYLERKSNAVPDGFEPFEDETPIKTRGPANGPPRPAHGRSEGSSTRTQSLKEPLMKKTCARKAPVDQKLFARFLQTGKPGISFDQWNANRKQGAAIEP